MKESNTFDLCIIGGAGHIGLPLGIAFAQKDQNTVLLDINETVLTQIASGNIPFKEEGCEDALKEALAKQKLHTSTHPEVISQSDFVVIVIGTPVDEHLNPNFEGITAVINRYMEHFRDGQIVILRSTVFPGTTDILQSMFEANQKKINVAFCPERIVQGKALMEIANLPQIIGATDTETFKNVQDLFLKITTKKTIRTTTKEAELAKLFSNAWRYISFSVANQFYMIAAEHGFDYQRIENAMKIDYPRNAHLPSPGLAAGPCLFKDTMQLASYANNTFFLGHAAMLVNEGLPNFIISTLKKENDLRTKNIGILGMAFKAENDDKRESLAYKLRRIARIESKSVCCNDPFIADPTFLDIEEVIQRSDIIIIATPHSIYKSIDTSKYPDKQFVDIWNHLQTRKANDNMTTI